MAQISRELEKRASHKRQSSIQKPQALASPSDRRVGASSLGFSHDTDLLKTLYREILYPRVIEEKMLLLLRQGKISKWFSGIGQEAIAVGASLAMHSDEYILPLHRNLGVFTTRKIPLERLFKQWQGDLDGFTKGRDRSFHFGTQEYRIVGMISHLGPQLCVADGIALAHRLKDEKKATLVFSGEGGTSEGDFHEALNVAAVWNLPVLFVVENNGYALSTPTDQQYRCEKISEKARGYGMEGITIDGNDVLTVYGTFDRLAKSVRVNPRPILIECMTFRMRGHEEASGTKYVPQELFEEWSKRDPILRLERVLSSQNVLSEAEQQKLRSQLKQEVDESIDRALARPRAPVVSSDGELSDVFAPSEESASHEIDLAPTLVKDEWWMRFRTD